LRIDAGLVVGDGDLEDVELEVLHGHLVRGTLALFAVVTAELERAAGDLDHRGAGRGGGRARRGGSARCGTAQGGRRGGGLGGRHLLRRRVGLARTVASTRGERRREGEERRRKKAER